MWPATSCSCCHNFPTMMDNTCELWAKTNPSILRLPFQVFSHDNDEKIVIELLLMLTTSVSYMFSLNFLVHNHTVLFLSDIFVHPPLFLSCCCGYVCSTGNSSILVWFLVPPRALSGFHLNGLASARFVAVALLHLHELTAVFMLRRSCVSVEG